MNEVETEEIKEPERTISWAFRDDKGQEKKTKLFSIDRKNRNDTF